jgi:hypothetical protein
MARAGKIAPASPEAVPNQFWRTLGAAIRPAGELQLEAKRRKGGEQMRTPDEPQTTPGNRRDQKTRQGGSGQAAASNRGEGRENGSRGLGCPAKSILAAVPDSRVVTTLATGTRLGARWRTTLRGRLFARALSQLRITLRNPQRLEASGQLTGQCVDQLTAFGPAVEMQSLRFCESRALAIRVSIAAMRSGSILELACKKSPPALRAYRRWNRAFQNEIINLCSASKYFARAIW